MMHKLFSFNSIQIKLVFLAGILFLAGFAALIMVSVISLSQSAVTLTKYQVEPEANNPALLVKQQLEEPLWIAQSFTHSLAAAQSSDQPLN